MSLVTLERTHIRLLKQRLREGLLSREALYGLVSAARREVAAGCEWRHVGSNDDWLGLPATTRFLRRMVWHVPDPARCLEQLEQCLLEDERALRRLFRELAVQLVFTGAARGEAELTAFWNDLASDGPPADLVLVTIRSGKLPPVPTVVVGGLVITIGRRHSAISRTRPQSQSDYLLDA